jgi:hypothetical protein
MVNSVELIGTTECPTLQMKRSINPCCYNQVQNYMIKYETNIAYTADRGLKILYQHTNNISACLDAGVLVTRTIKHYTQQNTSLMETKTDCYTQNTQFFFLTLHAQSVFCYCVTYNAPQ